jgi:hypothetical protein
VVKIVGSQLVVGHIRADHPSRRFVDSIGVYRFCYILRYGRELATNQKVGSSNLSGPRHWELRPDSGLKVECYGSTNLEIGAEAASRRKIFSEGAAAGAGEPDAQAAAQTSGGAAGGVVGGELVDGHSGSECRFQCRCVGFSVGIWQYRGIHPASVFYGL